MTKQELQTAKDLEQELEWCKKAAQTIVDMQSVPREYKGLKFGFATEKRYYLFEDSSRRTAGALTETILMLLHVQTQKELREAMKRFDEFTGTNGFACETRATEIIGR